MGEGLDSWIASLGQGSVLLSLGAAILLGLRHATDPDHVTAVSTRVFSGREEVRRRAGRLGLAWGVGHATTLLLLGLPVVIVGPWVPDAVTRIAEFAIGLVIVALAVRLLLRWRRGYLHLHVHEHDGTRHAHPHMHEQVAVAGHPARHAHRHDESLGRSPREAFGIGLVHGIGGSAGAGVLLVMAAPTTTLRIVALLLFAGGTAVSMAMVSWLVGHGLATGLLGRRFERVVPVLGVASLVFGLWYASQAF
jgi:high-affinity nickel permease